MHCEYSTWVDDSLTKYDSFPISALFHFRDTKSEIQAGYMDPKTEGNINLLDCV